LNNTLLKNNDHELLLELYGGSSDAFEALVRAHAEYFYQAAYRIVLSKEDAEDIVQDSFMKLLNGKAKWNPDKQASFRTWFYRIICNQAISHTRKKPHEEFNEALHANAATSPGEILEKKEASDAVLRALKRLTLPQRMAVELFYYSEMKQKDAAKAMEISQKAYESQLGRAKSTLKQELLEYA
jgi:RNA polymerase sigma-70 factor, ECF subfamily